MRIDNTKRPAPAAGVGSYRKASTTAGSAPAPRAADAASVLGIPQNELTPKVQEAITQLMAEVDNLRQELDQSMSRVEYLEQLADQDSLAPVANRRAFVRELTRTLSYAERYGTPSSVIYLDLNGLKQLNDTKGHAAGDAAILKVAKILAANVRESDIVGRLGGDEFGVMLSHADEDAAHGKAEFLAKSIAEDPLEWEGEMIVLEVAFGVHTIRGGGDAGAALEAADRAMYAHKTGIKKEPA
jgi:diguanylate cyclase (GGDEF)-like protein